MGVDVEPVAVTEVVEVDEVEVEVEVEVVTMTMMTTKTMTTKAAPHPLPSRVFPDAREYEIDDDELTGSSTTPRCNNNSLKSCKINVKRLRVDALQGSPPPTPSRRPTKTDDAPP